MTGFDTVIVVDWSARSAPSPKEPSPDAIWIGVADDGAETTHYLRTRAEAMAFLEAEITTRISAGLRVLAGFDFPLGYPAGFAKALTGRHDPFAVWDWLAARIVDSPDNRNNRFHVASELNRAFPGIGPFWGRPASAEIPGLPEKGTARAGHGMSERRVCEEIARTAQPVWKLYTTGSVGSQTLLGIPRLSAFRASFGDDCAVWPFEAPDTPLVIAEVYPSLLSDSVNAICAADPHAIKDEVQVRLLARALRALASDLSLFEVPEPAAREEAWILGLGHEAALVDAAQPKLTPPRLRNDCFALPPGVDWVPVDLALARLKGALSPVVLEETVSLSDAAGRVLSRDHVALRSNPPRPNVAVDGYGFAHASTGSGPQLLPLHPGRAAAGSAFDGRVPEARALRVLTGAVVPDGVDTVVLEEDVTSAEGHIAFDGPVKIGANTRKAGEDVGKGDVALPAGHCLRPQDLALLTALGLAEIRVRAPLNVGVLSTGDELAEAGEAIGPDRIYDANRPMLLSLARQWDHTGIDLGIASDSRNAVRDALNDAATRCDAILTSGGASAGDEDHISAILRDEGHVEAWRIALKPGRPLMLGLWQGVPVFGMPGNPVAAFVCALIFARPALSVLAGRCWLEPVGFEVPAGFSKRKKPGRREYLRARIGPNGQAEVFKSEGSGRISGLSWAEGLVELDDGPREIAPGDPVRYLPFGSFGL